MASAEARPIAQAGQLELVMPANSKGIGEVILAPEAPRLIEGIQIAPLKIWPDDRGYFFEIQRIGQGIASAFPPGTSQVSAALNYPGSIKAFHYHLHQTDCWSPVAGMLQVALVDLRRQSRTFGLRNTMYVGMLRPWQLLIPPGIAHGYKVIGAEPALLVYMTDRFYNPSDEGRIPYNEPGINYDWEIQHK